MTRANQNLTIAQVIKFLNERGYLCWRQENNGRLDEAKVVERLTELLVALAHVNYKADKVAKLITDILRKGYKPVPCSLKGVSDVIGFHLKTGRWMSVEIKTENDNLREEQHSFLKKVKDAGGEAWVCFEIGSFKSAWYRKHQPQLEAA